MMVGTVVRDGAAVRLGMGEEPEGRDYQDHMVETRAKVRRGGCG
jgi:hypothetical protein